MQIAQTCAQQKSRPTPYSDRIFGDAIYPDKTYPHASMKSCLKCTKPFFPIAQIYAQNENYIDRIIYIQACIECNEWIVYRALKQPKTPPITVEKPKQPMKKEQSALFTSLADFGAISTSVNDISKLLEEREALSSKPKQPTPCANPNTKSTPITTKTSDIMQFGLALHFTPEPATPKNKDDDNTLEQYKLLTEYKTQLREGDDPCETFEKEEYEPNPLKILSRFLEYMDSHPYACVRYGGGGKELGGGVLWYAAPDKSKDTSTSIYPLGESCLKCGLCGGKRSFEFQLLPGLLNERWSVEPAYKRGLDFATVVVYTCDADCAPSSKDPIDEWTFVQEVALVQRDIQLLN